MQVVTSTVVCTIVTVEGIDELKSNDHNCKNDFDLVIDYAGIVSSTVKGEPCTRRQPLREKLTVKIVTDIVL